MVPSYDTYEHQYLKLRVSSSLSARKLSAFLKTLFQPLEMSFLRLEIIKSVSQG